MRTYIIIRTAFIGWHRFIKAPKTVAFLKNWHRHVFNVEVWYEQESDRGREFFIEKTKLEKYLLKYNGKRFESSCEMIAKDILWGMKAWKVRVFEDNENGGEVCRCNSGINDFMSPASEKSFIKTT